MAMTEKIMWKVYAGALGAVTTIVAQKVVSKIWEAATGDTPPDLGDPEAPMTQAFIWAAASGIGVGMAQLAANRMMHKRWMANYQHHGPSRLRTVLG